MFWHFLYTLTPSSKRKKKGKKKRDRHAFPWNVYVKDFSAESLQTAFTTQNGPKRYCVKKKKVQKDIAGGGGGIKKNFQAMII